MCTPQTCAFVSISNPKPTAHLYHNTLSIHVSLYLSLLNSNLVVKVAVFGGEIEEEEEEKEEYRYYLSGALAAAGQEWEGTGK